MKFWETAISITPKGVMGGIHHHIFAYRYLTSSDVRGGHTISVLWEIRPMDNFPTIMHYELRIEISFQNIHHIFFRHQRRCVCATQQHI